MNAVQLALNCSTSISLLASHSLPEVEIFNALGQRMLAAHTNTTPHDAANASGSYRYLAGIKNIRDLLVPKGWEPETINNLELTINRDRKIAIMIASGDKLTGVLGNGDPRTRNDKGNQTAKRVDFNSRQISFSGDDWELPNRIEDERLITWILLHYVDKISNEMRMEVSLPIYMDELNHVSQWRERLILPSIPFGSNSPLLKPEFAPDPEIVIRRRKSE